MPSPFPGIDPYLERHWGDIHADLVAMTRTALNAILPGDLIARMEERIVIDRIDYSKPRAIYADVRAVEDPNRVPSGGARPEAAVAEPIVLEFESDEHTESYVTILDPDGGELVTVIEFLSPGNKLPGAARDDYRRKRDELFAARVNLVEIDLIRQGNWRDLLAPIVAPTRIQTEYRGIVRRMRPKPRVELFPMSLRQRLPVLPIPLREQDSDVTLDLQVLIEQTYVNGRYGGTDYTRECEPPLSAEDATWAAELFAKAGKTTAR